jgi:hypothetical protein
VAGRGFVGVWKDEASAVFMAADRADKEALLATAPDKFFTTPHYATHVELGRPDRPRDHTEVAAGSGREVPCLMLHRFRWRDDRDS